MRQNSNNKQVTINLYITTVILFSNNEFIDLLAKHALYLISRNTGNEIIRT